MYGCKQDRNNLTRVRERNRLLAIAYLLKVSETVSEEKKNQNNVQIRSTVTNSK
jgi:hypothetical protein